MRFRVVRHPFLRDSEWDDRSSMLKVLNGHVGVHIGKLLHQTEKYDLLQRHGILSKCTFTEVFRGQLVEVRLGILAEREWCEVRLDERKEFLDRLSRMIEKALVCNLLQD